jgi:sulfite reductase (NADPH) hemoprotein beta-component
MGFCTPEQAVAVAEAVVIAQKIHGNRDDRKNARLKYTVERMGIDGFRNEVERLLGYKLGKARPFKFEHNGDRFGWTEDHKGNFHYTMFIANGRVLDTEDYKMMTGLREIAKVHKGDFRLTANQNLQIGNVSKATKPKIEKLLKEYKILDANGATGLRLNSMACVALPTCGLSLAESERYLPDLITELDEVIEESGLRHDAITVRMTGCPNGCARPYIAEIGFVGRGPGTYNLYLGAGFCGDRLSKLYRQSVKSTEIKAVLGPVIRDYAHNRKQGERFGDFVIRQGYVNATNAGHDFHKDLKPEALGT